MFQVWGLLLFGAGGVAAQTPALGPLSSEDGAPLHRIGLTAPAEAAAVLPRGETRWSAWLGLSNIFEQDSTATHFLLVDMERLISTAEVRRGITERVEVGARLTFETTGGGTLDGFVSWWHTRFGFGNANRERYPEGAYDQRLVDQARRILLDVPRRTMGLEDVRVFGKWRVSGAPDRPHLVSARATLRLPASGGGLVEERPDLGITLLGRISDGLWHGHGMLGATTVRARAEGPLPTLRSAAYHGMIGVERTLGDGWGAVVQYQVSTPLFRTFRERELDGPSANLAFGVVGRFGPDWQWDVSFQEDLPADTPAADFTLGVRVSRSW